MDDDMIRRVIKYVQLGSTTTRHRRDLKKKELTHLWGVSLDAAERTLNATTNSTIQVKGGPVLRCYKTRAHQRQYRQLGGQYGKFHSDTMFSKVKLIHGYTLRQ
eukprot:10601378-Ditylum_brightwellii.AAC.1